MIYYRVKKDYDNVLVNSEHFLVRNELYTENEVSNLNIPFKYLTKVEVKRNETFFVFGARFCYSCGYRN